MNMKPAMDKLRCDADPAALAKYVYALIKKDKPVQELRESMAAQLEVFLQKDTGPFVESLFEELQMQNSKEVAEPEIKVEVDSSDKNVPAPASSPPLPVDTAQNGLTDEDNVEKELEKDRENERERDILMKEKRNLSAALAAPNVAAAVVPSSVSFVTTGSSSNKHDSDRRPSHSRDNRDRNKSDSEKDDPNERERRPRMMGRSNSQKMRSRSPRSRSRSRSWEQRHSRRSRSRDRERDRSRAWRNKSPPPRRYDRERRRRWSKSPIRSKALRSRSRSRSPRSRSRSPPSKRVTPRYRNRSPPSPCSRSRSPRDMRLDKDSSSGPGTPTQDSNHADADVDLGVGSQSIQNAVNSQKLNGPVKQRCRDFDEKGYCMRGDLCPYDHGTDPVVVDDVQLPQMLSNYQANNLPHPSTKGPLLQPPLSLAPSNIRLGVPMRPPILPMNNNTSEYNPDAPSIELRVWGRPPFRGVANMRGMMRSTGMRNSIGTLPSAPMGYLHQRELVNVPLGDGTYQPEPLVMNYLDNNVIPPANSKRRGMYDFRPPGGRRGLVGSKINSNQLPQDNCSLELKKIPHSLNNITHLNNHFAKFGKIVNIQVSYEGDPEAALITFSTHQEAYAAYKSSEAVLNNRFIKVFWHNSEGKQENVPPRRPSVKERLGAAVITSPNKVLNTLQPEAVQHVEEDDNNPAPIRKASVKDRLGALNITTPPTKLLHTVEPTKQESTAPKSDQVLYSGSNLTKTMYINNNRKPETLQVTAVIPTENKVNDKVVTTNTVKKTQEIQAVKETIKKKREEIRKEALKLALDFRKRKQDLLLKQIANQKLLVERLEKGSVQGEQREELIVTIKSLQENIEKIQKEIAAEVDKMNETKVPAKVTPQLVKKTKEEAQRKILDAELDIFNQQQEGKDTTVLQKKVLELKMQVKTLGLLSEQPAVPPPTATSFATRGTNCYRSRRGARFVHTTVDHRTTKLLVSGFEIDDKEEVLAHFSQYGELIDYNIDESTPSLIITYKLRKDAENVIKKGRNFGDRLLSVTWYNAQQNAVNRRNSHRSVMLMREEPGEELLEEVEEEEEEIETGGELLLQDEEEEEDEDRSWRR